MKYFFTCLIAINISGNLLAKDLDSNLWQIFHKVSIEQNVPENLLRAICYTETGYRPTAYRNGDGGHLNSAFGICQVLYKTASQYGLKDAKCQKDFSKKKHNDKGCSLFDVEINLKYASKYLRYQLDRYKNDRIKAIAAYNAGSYIVCKDSGIFHAPTIDIKCVQGQIRNLQYVEKVLKALRENK